MPKILESFFGFIILFIRAMEVQFFVIIPEKDGHLYLCLREAYFYFSVKWVWIIYGRQANRLASVLFNLPPIGIIQSI